MTIETPAVPTVPTFEPPAVPAVTVAPAVAVPGPQARGNETFEDLPAEAEPGAASTPLSADELGDVVDDDGFDSRGFDDILAGKTPPTQPPATQVAPAVVAPAVVPPAPAAAVTPPVAAPVVAPPAVPAPPAQVQPEAPAAPVAPAARPENALAELDAGIQKSRDVVINALAQHYESTFSDEEIDQFQIEPKKALSKWAARLHVDSLQNTLKVLTANLPTMVNGLMEARTAEQSNSNEFYTAHPDLDRVKQGPLISQIAVTHRAMNPNMPKAQFIATLGAMVRAAAGIQAPTPVAAAPQAPPVRMPAGFVPAGTGQLNAPPASGANVNPWDAMTEAMIADDR